jgi:hypothetical protein
MVSAQWQPPPGIGKGQRQLTPTPVLDLLPICHMALVVHNHDDCHGEHRKGSHLQQTRGRGRGKGRGEREGGGLLTQTVAPGNTRQLLSLANLPRPPDVPSTSRWHMSTRFVVDPSCTWHRWGRPDNAQRRPSTQGVVCTANGNVPRTTVTMRWTPAWAGHDATPRHLGMRHKRHVRCHATRSPPPPHCNHTHHAGVYRQPCLASRSIHNSAVISGGILATFLDAGRVLQLTRSARRMNASTQRDTE